jgi:hypothetical protein
MKHTHKPGCRCALCLSEYERREGAAQQFYGLLQMSWVGMRTAVAYAGFARDGIEEAFPYRACTNLGHLRQHDADLLNSLLTDILD